MTQPLLKRQQYKPPPSLPFLGDLMLPAARVHEFCGPARRTLALMQARRMTGPIFWIHSFWQKDRLHGTGICKFIAPDRLTFVRPKRLQDILWSMEEVLRAGCVPLVVAELPEPPPLTPIRRLHLAAQTGAELTGLRPLGLLLTPGDGGAQGVETRWHLSPRHHNQTENWHLERRRARMDPPAAWTIGRGKDGFLINQAKPPTEGL